MPKISDNTMRELEDILNESETYADRLAAFLKQKTAPKPQSNTPFVLGDLDITFDFDVDLVKLPPKPQPAAKDTAAAKEQPLREITNQPPTSAEPKVQPEAPLVSNRQENAAPPTPPAPAPPITSPRRSTTRRSGVHVPGSDRLRRVAIHRRSRSCGRRDLLKEFNNASSNGSDFLPTVSSTPASEKQTAAGPEQPTQRESSVAPTVLQAVPHVEHRDELLSHASNSQHSMTHSSQRSTTPDSSAVKRRTYTVELGPEPGQLLLSPSRSSSCHNLRPQRSSSNSIYNTSLRQARGLMSRTREQAALSAARLELLASDTPPRITLPHTQPEPEYIVPETQPQPMQHMLQNLSSNAMVAPFVVMPMASMVTLSSKPAVAHVDAAAQVVAAPVATMASRSMQTSRSPPALQDDLMTDDESADERQASGAPLNLAPTGGNTTRQRNLRKRVQRAESSVQLLDLHRSRTKNSRHRGKNMPRHTVLNKPSQPAINGEQFAFELARMSNYEIMDLRKRNSLGRQHPVNGHREQPEEHQLVLDQHIEWEILRRNLDEPNEQAGPPPRTNSTATTVPTSENDSMSAASSISSPAAPPMGFRDSTMLESHQDSSRQHQRRSRLRRRETLMQTFEAASLSPAVPPAEFRDSSIQALHHQKAKRQPQPSRRLRSRHRELSTSEEDELQAVCTPPAQFRRSKSRQRERQQLLEPVLATPPLAFNDVPVTDAGEELQLQEQQLMPPAEFNSHVDNLIEQAPTTQPSMLEETMPSEQPSTSRAAQKSLRRNTSRQQSNQEKQQKEKERQLKKIQQEEEESQQQERQKEKKQAEKQQQEKEQAKQQQEKEHATQQKEKQQKEKLLLEQQQKEKYQQEQLQKEQQQEKQQQEMHQQEQLQEQQETPIQEQPQAEQPPPSDAVFKKPTAPAPRAKRNQKSYLERQLSNLRINLANETLPPGQNEDEADANTTGVRRSRRGQVQLCNTWVHTISDPFKFMRKTFDPPSKTAASKPKKRAAAASGSSLMERPPLSSSTPRNAAVTPNSGTTGKRKRAQQQHQNSESSDADAISGISRLSGITEQEEAEDGPVAQPPEPKRRGRKNKTPAVASDKPPNETTKAKKGSKKKQDNATVSQREEQEIPMPDLEQTPDLPPVSPLRNQSNEQSSETLMAWLCGDRDVLPDTTEVSEIKTDSMTVSRAANLHFSKIDGIEYAFYHTEDLYSMGYMRFQPLQQRGLKRAKTNTLRFVALHGQFEFEIINPDSKESYQDILYTGDTIEIKKGSRYNIINRLDKVSVIMVFRNGM
ncbi:trichohyalin-like [Drosophila montana]|uniref:trichohyalin-like n=1 Tax=Drosophila montana TaxID=40370 RepID=UPI00313C0911